MQPTEPVFRADAGRFIPTLHARGPWDKKALHGGAPAALMAGAVERFEPAPELFVSRLTFEFMRPVPLAPLELRIELARPGRRVQLVAASLFAADVEVCRLLALRVARSPQTIELDGVAEERPALRLPQALKSTPFSLGPLEAESFAGSAMEMRFASGGLELGPADVWMRLRRPIVDAEIPSPLVRVCAAADFGNGLSAVTSFERSTFINPDLSIHLDRSPAGDWVLLSARTRITPGAGALAWSTIADERGSIGIAAQSLLVENR